MEEDLSITPAQCRAARALLDMTQLQLAEISNISVSTISSFELGNDCISDEVLEIIKRSLQNEGIAFIGAFNPSSDCHGPGVRLSVTRT